MAYSIDIYDINGKKVSTFALDETLFSDAIVNTDLIHEYYLLQASNARINIAKVKGRGEVAGSGRKIYKQKGTGNARAGDKNSPIRRGGGVAFGPRGERNFTKVMTKKARKIALQGLLTLKAQQNELMGVQKIGFTTPKTKPAAELLQKLGLQSQKVLFVMSDNDENLKKSFRNLEGVKYLSVDYLNPFDLMHADKVLFTEASLAKLNQA
ncbi:MAG: 50S ribosomal protein L4 [candidate division SR1 bacterium]|nr:50S ribosomal protein L4 [candidate division SR1 bacterium]